MDRDSGLRRTTALTAALAVASVAGTVAVGAAAYASHSSAASPAGTVVSSPSGNADPPSLSTGSDDSGQATSGGS